MIYPAPSPPTSKERQTFPNTFMRHFMTYIYPCHRRGEKTGFRNVSRVWQELQCYAFTPAGHLLCLYVDPAYTLRVHLQGPFKGAIITPQMQAFNSAMSTVRISVEWLFGDSLQDYLDHYSRTTLFNSSTQIIG